LKTDKSVNYFKDIAPTDKMTISLQIFLNSHNHYKDK